MVKEKTGFLLQPEMLMIGSLAEIAKECMERAVAKNDYDSLAYWTAAHWFYCEMYYKKIADGTGVIMEIPGFSIVDMIVKDIRKRR